MTIRINQTAVDFTLEKERTFSDLSTSLREWAESQNLAILGILADGKAIGIEENLMLDEIGEIEVEAVTIENRDLASAEVIARFFSLFSFALKNEDQNLIVELYQEYPSVKAALFPLFATMSQRLLPPLAVLDTSWNDRVLVKDACNQLAHETQKFHFELQQPEKALSEILDSLDETLISLEKLSGFFQKGRDREGFSLILQLFTQLEDLGRRVLLTTASRGPIDQKWQDFSRELQPILKESEEALTCGDYILLTDLIEYEVAPRLREVRSLFPEMTNLDPTADSL